MTERGTPWRFSVDVGADQRPTFGGHATFTDEQFWRSQVNELSIGEWFHMEALDFAGRAWFLRVGDRCEVVALTRAGKVKRITDQSA